MLHRFDPTVDKVVELSVLVVANLVATLVRFVALRRVFERVDPIASIADHRVDSATTTAVRRGGRDTRARRRRAVEAADETACGDEDLTRDVLGEIAGEIGVGRRRVLGRRQLRRLSHDSTLPFVDVVVDAAGQKGTGRWTVISALELGSPTSGIAESVFARALSSQTEQRRLAQELLAGGEAAVEVPESFVEDVRQALYASKLVSYAQGLDMLTSAAKEYGWDLKLDEIASLWRGGCIIRAELLKEITKAYAAEEKPANLLFAPAFTKAIAEVLPAWRRVVSTAVQLGIPVPVFSSSLAYYDGLRRKRLPAAVIQGQRDLFGAHTYGRVDAEGTFHTLWGEDKSEIEAVDTH